MLLPLLMGISIPIAYYLKGFTWEESIIIGPLVNVLAFLFLGALPTFLIHRSHLKYRVASPPHIDTKKQTIFLNDIIYPIDSLDFTHHLAWIQKSKQDGKFRLTTPWSNYSYIAVKTKQDQTFYLSSTQIIMDQFFVEISQKQYHLFPYLKQ
jgi:hypothetical protein